MVVLLLFAAAPAAAETAQECAGDGDAWSRLSACTDVIEGGDWPGARAAWAYSNRAMAHAELGNHLDAFDDHDTALKLDPGNPRAWNNRATSHARFREYDRAFRDYRRALELDPGYINALINRASLYAETGQPAEAWADYGTAIALEDAAGRDTAGLAFLQADAACQLGEAEDALAGRQPAFENGLFSREEMAATLINTGYLVRGVEVETESGRAAFDAALERWTLAGCVWD
ncbi:MAG: tetratricopeptide repeat protein [Pseudomonadota bacterium]